MKNVYLFVISVITGLSVCAQPTINSSVNPAVGDNFIYHIVNGSGMAAGSGGANASWNFASVSPTGTDTSTYITLSSSTQGSNHPNANIALESMGNEAYLLLDNNGWSRYGEYLQTGGSTQYTDKREFVEYPMSYNTSYNNTFGGTITNSVPQTFNRSGTIVSEGDAYGDLTLPYGTISNVLRVRIVSDYQDTHSTFPTYYYKDTIYMWFEPSTKSYLASYSVLYVNGSQATEYGTYLDPAFVSVEEVTGLTAEQSVNVFPNPATEVLNIHNNSNDPVQLELFNSLGQVQVELTMRGKEREVYPITNIEKGLYFLTTYSEDGKKLKTEKLIIQ